MYTEREGERERERERETDRGRDKHEPLNTQKKYVQYVNTYINLFYKCVDIHICMHLHTQNYLAVCSSPSKTATCLFEKRFTMVYSTYNSSKIKWCEATEAATCLRSAEHRTEMPRHTRHTRHADAPQLGSCFFPENIGESKSYRWKYIWEDMGKLCNYNLFLSIFHRKNRGYNHTGNVKKAQSNVFVENWSFNGINMVILHQHNIDCHLVAW